MYSKRGTVKCTPRVKTADVVARFVLQLTAAALEFSCSSDVYAADWALLMSSICYRLLFGTTSGMKANGG